MIIFLVQDATVMILEKNYCQKADDYLKDGFCKFHGRSGVDRIKLT